MTFPSDYDLKSRERHWQDHWLKAGTYHWDESASRADTYVIDTPPPTVSGLLHMGHVFSYAQADFIARYQRMSGKTVFYPMGFDDNGLPTERLVEKAHKKRAVDMSREDFIKLCLEVSEESRKEYRRLFESTALSVDWRQEYHTISEESRRLSQMSFLDLLGKGEVYRKLQPMLWDPVDQTAIAQAEIEDKELPSHFSDLWFEVIDAAGQPLAKNAFPPHVTSEGDEQPAVHFREVDGHERSYIVIGTTRPEMLPACVAVFYHPEDPRYRPLEGAQAITPLFGVRVPILTDDTVEPDKGSGIMMCCTFGDEKDIEKWRKHDLPTRLILNKYGKLDFSSLRGGEADAAIHPLVQHAGQDGLPRFARNDETLDMLQNLKVSNTDPKHPGARQKILELLAESGDLIVSRPITHAVKCAERSGAPLEILPTHQWFVRVLDKKETLKARAAESVWHPEYMKLRVDQWIDGLSWDWCISRQRYFGVPFPVWYSKRPGEEGKVLTVDAARLPVNPLVDLPDGYTRDEVEPDTDVMDTWATSSISPQLSSKGINRNYSPLVGESKPASQVSERGAFDQLAPVPQDSPHQNRDAVLTPPQGGSERYDDISNPFVLDPARHEKLFPADLRPQAHEIIRTWAFYTIVKAELHEQVAPWKNLLISGWCLAADKTKMSKSKGNVVTPVELLEEKGSDAVRYWASTSRPGVDTAFSEDALKIGRKLTTKLWNASKFASGLLDALEVKPATAESDIASHQITHTLDRWILTELGGAVTKATAAFEAYEYADARAAAEDFFWNAFCDNYLELVKSRAYGNETPEGRQSALHAIHLCLNGILKLFAPFVPHITEELFAMLFPTEYDVRGSIHAQGAWPKAELYPIDPEVESIGAAVCDVLQGIRKMKSNMSVSIKTPLALLEVAPLAHRLPNGIQDATYDLASAANVEKLVWLELERGLEDGENSIVSENSRYVLYPRWDDTAAAS